MSESTDPEPIKSDDQTVKCPWCGQLRLLAPHPTKKGRLAAYCDCQGDWRPFHETEAPDKPKRRAHKQESD